MTAPLPLTNAASRATAAQVLAVKVARCPFQLPLRVLSHPIRFMLQDSAACKEGNSDGHSASLQSLNRPLADSLDAVA